MSKIIKSHKVTYKKEPFSLPIKDAGELRQTNFKNDNKEHTAENGTKSQDKQFIDEKKKKAEEEAEKILEKAREEAQKEARSVVEKAREEEEKIKQEAKQAGYEEGYNQGYQDGEGKAMAEIKNKENELLRSAELELEKAIKKRNKILASLEREVCELVFLVAEKVLDRRIEEDKELVASMVKNGLLALEGENKVMIKTHPNDYVRLRSHIEDFKTEFNELFIELKEDSNVSMGAPVLKVDTGYIELDVSKQARELQHCVKQVIQNG